MPSSSSLRTDHTFFLDHLARESSRFREAIADAEAGRRVPTCPDWDADDLLWHLAGVQWFWGEIVERRLTTREQVDRLVEQRVSRPGDRAGVLEHFDRSSARLEEHLRATPPDTEVWMWADEHSAAYVARRQAHEALIHRVDAELTVGAGTPMDPALSVDGVDEALRIMRAVEPEDGLVLTAISAPVSIVSTDVDGAWTVIPTHVTGADSDGGAIDLTRFVVQPGYLSAAARIEGAAADLDRWLWNRPAAGQVRRQGDPSALGAVDRVLGGTID